MFKESKPDSPRERFALLCKQRAKMQQWISAWHLPVCPRLSNRKLFFCVKQTKVLALKNTIKDPYRSAVSGKRIEAERQMIEIESSSPYVLSFCLKVSQYFSLFPISQQCDGFFNCLNIGKKKCYTMSRNQRQSLPPPPPHKKKKKKWNFFKKQQLVKRLHGKRGLFPSSYDTRPAYC